MRRRWHGPRASPWLLAASLGAGTALGCHSAAFNCSTDDQCVDGSVGGVCQPTGWCSFEDAECPSMQRYGELSASDLAGTCVPETPEGSTGAAETGAVETGAAESSEVTTGGDSGPSLDATTESGSTSLPPLDTGSEGSSSDAEGGSTTGEPQACEIVLFDDFEDGMVDAQWDPWQDGGTSLQEADSALRFSLVGDVLAGDDAGVTSLDQFDLSAGYLRLEIAEVPTPDTEMELYWQLVTETCTITGLVEAGMVYAFDGVGEYGDGTHWLQMRFEAGLGYLERSVDGIAWEAVLAPVRLDCQPVEAEVLVFGGAGAPTMTPATAAVGTVEACG
jgi:hypothetical protein